MKDFYIAAFGGRHSKNEKKKNWTKNARGRAWAQFSGAGPEAELEKVVLLTSQVYAQHCRHCGVDFANFCYYNDGSQVSNSLSLKRQKLKLGDPGSACCMSQQVEVARKVIDLCGQHMQKFQAHTGHVPLAPFTNLLFEHHNFPNGVY